MTTPRPAPAPKPVFAAPETPPASPIDTIDTTPRAPAAPTQSADPASDELATLRAENAELRTTVDESIAMVEAMLADNQMMGKVFEADDQLAAALAEVKRLTTLNALLDRRIGGLMTEKNELIRRYKGAQRELERLKKGPHAA
jgi:hypothetical protein